MGEDLPFFADGTIVGDYRPLKKYWEILRRMGLDLGRAFLRREDFEYLKRIVEEKRGIDVASLLEELTSYFLDRVDRRAAVEACSETYGVEFVEEEAVKKIAYILAGWLIEAGKNTGLLRLRGRWEGR